MKFIAAAIYDDEKLRQRTFLVLITISSFYSSAPQFYDVGFLMVEAFFVNFRFSPLRAHKSLNYLQEQSLNVVSVIESVFSPLRALHSIFAYESGFCYPQIKAENVQIFAARNKQHESMFLLLFFPIKASRWVYEQFSLERISKQE